MGRPLKPETVAFILNAQERGLTRVQIAAAAGVSETTVQWRLKQNGRTKPHIPSVENSRGGRPKGPRLSYQVFADYLKWIGRNYSNEDISFKTGIHTKEISRWKANGLTFYMADKVCTRLGLLPQDIWGESAWFGDASELEELLVA